MERRTLLQTAAVALTAGVAGCGGDGGDGSDGGDGATDTPTATATQTQTPEPTATATETQPPADDQTATPTETATGPQTQVVAVAPNRSLRFEPKSFTISVGETVRWEWKDGGHNVTPDEIPDASTWAGTTADDQYTYDAGYTHSHTFEVAGEYAYFCDPHRSTGMTGSFTVTE